MSKTNEITETQKLRVDGLYQLDLAQPEDGLYQLDLAQPELLFSKQSTRGITMPQSEELSPAHLRAIIEMVASVNQAHSVCEAQLAVSVYAESVRSLFGVDPAMREMTLGEIARRWPRPTYRALKAVTT